MGRGRAKAKQTRVARDLKYRSYDMDLKSLERELRGDQNNGDVQELTDDEYSAIADRYRVDEDDDEQYDSARRYR